eukprot:c2506_g1_i1 orf=106-1920(+)
MDDVKSQFKGLVKKLNNPFASSSSSRFKGEGHKLGNGPDITPSHPQQAKTQPSQPKHQQGDWRKLQQERWAKERSPHPAPRQDISQLSDSSPTQSQPCKTPINKHSSAHIPISSADSSSKRPNDESYEVSISDALQAQKLDHERISEAENLQKVNGSDPRMHGPGALEAQKFDHVQLSSSDGVHSNKDERSDPQEHGGNGDLHANYDGNEKSKEFVGVHANNSNVDRGQSGQSPMFDPFLPQIGTKSSSANSDGLQMYQCPVCGSWWRSESEVNVHVDECLSQSASTPHTDTKSGEEQIKVALGVFLSGGPSSETMDVFVRILRNISTNPDVEKFRKIRLSNPKIHDTVGMALGGVEVLEAVGFDYQTEEDEIWAVMGPPSVDQIKAIEGVISELEACTLGSSKEECSSKEERSSKQQTVQRKVDRQVRVYYATTENLAAKMELPDSFFQLSAVEMRREAAARKKKLEDSQLLISKTSREKMASANKQRYKAAIIRIQFPDGVVLQGMFLPWERTTAIYEFVSASLRDPSTQFSLVAPGLSRKQIIPALADGTVKIPTLAEANLVPAVLLKFQCAESDSLTFTGLHPDILAKIEPLSSTAICLQ